MAPDLPLEEHVRARYRVSHLINHPNRNDNASPDVDLEANRSPGSRWVEIDA